MIKYRLLFILLLKLIRSLKYRKGDLQRFPVIHGLYRFFGVHDWNNSPLTTYLGSNTLD